MSQFDVYLRDHLLLESILDSHIIKRFGLVFNRELLGMQLESAATALYNTMRRWGQISFRWSYTEVPQTSRKLVV